MPCPGPFQFSHIYVDDFCPLPDPDEMLVLLSLYLTRSLLLSMLDCAAASWCCAYLVSVHVSAPYVIGGSTMDVRCLYVFRPACHDSSLYILCRYWVCYTRYTKPSTFSISTMFTLIEVLSTSITFVFAMFIFRSISSLPSDSYCSICCDCCAVPNA